MANLSQGLSIRQLRAIVAKLMINISVFDELCLQEFLKEKQIYISQTSLFKFVKPKYL